MNFVSQAEHEKNAKDNQIKTLQGEMAQQDESIAKLNKGEKTYGRGSEKDNGRPSKRRGQGQPSE